MGLGQRVSRTCVERAARPRRAGAFLTIPFVILLLVSACAPAASQPASLTKITVAVPSSAAPSAELWVIKDAGLFEKYGLDVDLKVISGAPQLLAAIVSGQVPISQQASPAVFQAALNGADIVMFAGIVNTTFFTIFSHPNLTEVPALRGKRIGASPVGSSDEATLAMVLARYGLTRRDVTVLDIASQADRIAALQNGSVDAIVIAPPFTFKARSLGLHELIDTSALNLEYQSSAFVVTRSFLKSNRDVVVRFTRALSEGIKYYKTHKPESIKSISRLTGETDPNILDQTYDLFALKYTTKVPYLSLSGLQYVLDNVVQDPKAKQHTVNDFIDQSVVKQLDDEGVYKQLWGNNTSGV